MQPEDTPTRTEDTPTELYLNLLKRCLTRYELGESHRTLSALPLGWRRRPVAAVQRLLGFADLELVLRAPFDPALREVGRDWPPDAETMVGLKRLDNLHELIRSIVRTGTPGDVLEAGVWRGGASIFMAAALKAYGDLARKVWVADSFQGLPRPSGAYEPDTGDSHWKARQLSVTLEEVKQNFSRYDVLDERVVFLPGWFSDTLVDAPLTELALLRLDGDMYESTIDTLEPLYPKVAPGGYVVVDDYHAIPGCKAAVDDYRREHGIDAELVGVDWTAVYWQKP